MAEPEESIPSVLLPCNSCGRTFRPDALTKHAKYCEKSLIKKRKVFDSAKQRLQGDLAECLPVLATQKKKPDKSPIRKTQSKWKEKHLEFVRAIRAAKGESEGGSVPAPPSKPVDHEKCLYCDRYFGPKAYDRHLEWCKEHSSLVRPKSPASIQAKQRLEARTKYKAPLLNRTRRASISEKCSPKSCTRDPSPAADRLTRTRSSSLSSRTVTSMNREPLSNVSPKNNAVAVVDSFRRNQPARNSRRSVSPLKRTTPETAKNKTVNNNLNQNNRTRGRQLASYEMKNESKREVKSTPKSAKDDMFSASCNISPITPGQNQKLKTRTPSHNSMENYDPYKSAERQMKELLGLSDDDDAPLVHSLVPQPPPHSSSASLLNSFHSAFAKFSPIHSHRDASDHPSPDSDLDNNDFERLEAESRVVTPGGIVDKNFNPMSLSTISLCSTISIESFDNSRNNLRKGVSLSAKVQSGDRKASLPLQRSVSVVEAPRRGKSNLKMEDLLFGNNYNNNNHSFNNDDVDNKSLKSSNELLKTSNFGDSFHDIENKLLRSSNELLKTSNFGESFHDIDNKPLKSSNELLKTSNYGDSLYDIDNKPRRSSNESSKTSNYVDSLHDNDNKPRRPSNELLKNSNYVDSLHDNDNKPRRPSNELLKNSNYGDSLHDIDNKQLRSSNKLLKTSNSSLEDASRAEQELLKSVSEFEKLFAAPASSLNPYSPLMPNSSPASNLAPLESIDKHRSQAGKFIIDSAYNSLNRKSPQEGSPVDLDNCSSGSECSSTRGKAAQTANFCHECGAKFPVLAAKFCCNCGVRRLVI